VAVQTQTRPSAILTTSAEGEDVEKRQLTTTATRIGSALGGAVAAGRRPGPLGNKRLTTSVGLVLLVLLALETLTTLSLRSYLPVHIFLGLLLVPPIVLKLASAGWRFVRYYAGNKQYKLAGPPKLSLRLLAPLLIASTLTLFGSGVALILVGHGGGMLLSVHALSFYVWGVLMIVHVVAYFSRTLRVGTADWRRHAELVVAGTRSRRAALIGSLLAGVILAVATYPTQQAWRSDHRDDRSSDRLVHAPAVAIRQTTPGAR
jgi:hypothetical protein